MRRLSVDINDTGPHNLIVPAAGEKIIVNALLFTFAHANDQALPITFLSGDRIIYGPFLVLDGGQVTYELGDVSEARIGPGETFKIQLAPGLSCAGEVEWEVGAW